MKKKLSLVLALVMAFTMLFALTACTKTPEEQLADAFKKLDANNMSVVMEMNASGFGIEFEIQIDGNLMKVIAMGQELYIEIDEETEKVYTYTPDEDGSYSKEEGSLEDVIGIDSESEEMLAVFFVAENYTYSEEEEKFIFNEDKLPEVENGPTGATVVLNDDGSFTITIGDDSVSMIFTFGDFNEVEIKLPTVA